MEKINNKIKAYDNKKYNKRSQKSKNYLFSNEKLVCDY